MGTLATLTPPEPTTPHTPTPESGALVTPDILYNNQGASFRLAAAFGGTGNPTAIWQQLIDDGPWAIVYMRELEEKDEDVGDAVDEMKLSVMKRQMKVMPANEKDSKAVDIAQFVQGVFDNLPNWRNSMMSLLDAPFYGYCVAEQIFDVSSGQVMLTDICDRPQELFDFAPIGYPQIGQLRLKQYIGGEGDPVPENKFVVWSSRPRGGNRKGRPLIRNVFWPSWIKRNVVRFWLKYAEKGPGTAVVQYASGNADERRKALDLAEAIINNTAVAAPETYGLVKELLTSARPIDPATYEKLQQMLSQNISRRIVGSTLTSRGGENGKGTQALGRVHQDTKEDRSVEHTMQLESMLNRQVIRQLVWWNYGPDAPMPLLIFDKSNEEDLGEQVTVDDTLQEMGLLIPESYARKRYGIPAPVENEPVLVRPQAVPTSITTPAGTPDSPQFSSGQQLVDKELSQFDTLFDQMREEGLDIYRKRVAQLAEGSMHANIRPGA